MQHKIATYFDDILDSAKAIILHTNGITKYADFMSNRTVYRAVEREIEIIVK